jgi:hypothetical protein
VSEGLIILVEIDGHRVFVKGANMNQLVKKYVDTVFRGTTDS